MRRPLRILLQPRWLALHLLVAVLAVTMVLLGRWQLHVSEAKHFSWQNFIYTVQWWTFTAFLLFFWVRVMRDAVRPPAPTAPGGALVVARAGDSTPASGPALMVADDDGSGAAPTLYRGYLMPQLSRQADRRGDDTLRSPYNDHLWQLALADAANGEGPMPTTPRPLVDTATLAARARAAAARGIGAAEGPALPAAPLDRPAGGHDVGEQTPPDDPKDP